MKTVSLVCTVHEEVGRANVSELHAILERIRPEVVFLEAPAVPPGSNFAIESLRNIEAAAAIHYRTARSVALVPVDLPTPDESFFRTARELFGDLPRASYEYDSLMAENSQNVRVSGFVYLNGNRFSEYQSALNAETLRVLERLKNPAFSEFYKSWIERKDQRERAMAQNIGRYCRENEFGRAAFLVGAAHRDAIVTLSKQIEWVQWDYSGNGAW